MIRGAAVDSFTFGSGFPGREPISYPSCIVLEWRNGVLSGPRDVHVEELVPSQVRVGWYNLLNS